MDGDGQEGQWQWGVRNGAVGSRRSEPAVGHEAAAGAAESEQVGKVKTYIPFHICK